MPSIYTAATTNAAGTSLSSRLAVFWLVLFVVASAVVPSGAFVDATSLVTYDANLTLVLGSLSYAMQPQSSDGSMGTFHLSMFQAPMERNNAAYAKIVVAAAPLCLASHGSGITELTLAQLGSILYGNVTVSFRVVLGPVATSAASYQLLQSLNDRGVAGFESAADWAPAVKANGNIVWVSNDTELSRLIEKRSGVIGPQASMLTTAAGVACLRIRLTSASGDSVAVSQQPTTTSIENTLLDVATSRVTTQGVVYPLVGGLMVTSPVNITCDELTALRSMLTYFYTDSNVSSILAAKNMVSFDNNVQFQIIGTLHSLTNSSCTTATLNFTAVGELSAYEALAQASLTELPDGPYLNVRTLDGAANVTKLLASVASGNTTVALLDSPSVAQVSAAIASGVLVAPLLAVSVAVAYNLDGFETLMASPCTMLGLLNGSIAYWDDSAVLGDNVGISVPHVAVLPLISHESTTRTLIGGMNRLYQVCHGTSAVPFDVDGEWPFNVSGTLDYVTAYRSVRTVFGSIALVPSPMATNRGLQVMSLLLPTGAVTLASQASATAALAAASLDSTTNVVVLPSQGVQTYPFVSTVHVAFRSTYSATDCAAATAAVGFVQYANDQDSTAIESYGYALMPTRWRGGSSAAPPGMSTSTAVLNNMLAKLTCDGTTIIASTSNSTGMMPPQATTASTSESIVGVVLGTAAGVGVLFGGLAALRMARARSHGRAPKDEGEPFAIVFTDIQSSTALWATAPVEMGPALDQHHALMREAIAATGGYEVKTIGDSFMVAYRSAKDAVRFGLLVQRLFHDAEWAGVFDEFYRAEVGAKDDTDAAVLAQYDSAAYGSLWRGLRVRVGVHYGAGQIKLDPVTQAYDYYGTVVNTAARVEAVGHGGQVCVTAAALEAANMLSGEAIVATEGVSVKDLGPQELYGLTEPVRLYQVLPIELGARLFPPPRTNSHADDDDVREIDPAAAADDDARSVSSTGSVGNVDEIAYFMDAASAKTDVRTSNSELIAYYNFVHAMSKILTDAGGKTNPIQQLYTIWGVTGAPVGRLERRLVQSTGLSVLHKCRFVLRVALNISRKRGGATRGGGGDDAFLSAPPVPTDGSDSNDETPPKPRRNGQPRRASDVSAGSSLNTSSNGAAITSYNGSPLLADDKANAGSVFALIGALPGHIVVSDDK